MGFRSPQFDFIDQRFSHRHLKTLDVSCTKRVQAHLSTPALIASGSSLLPIINLQTGQLLPGVRIVITDIDVGATVIPNKVCNVFNITWQVIDANNMVWVDRTDTIADAVDCPGAGGGPSQAVIQKHDIQVDFCLMPVDTDNNGFVNLLFADVIVRYCLIVSNESVLKIHGALPFCS